MNVRPIVICLTTILLSACGPVRTPRSTESGPGISTSGKILFQQGLASWYGKPFHGRRTASGEVYDMYRVSAAHKTLPLGTRVLVRNEKNGRELVVRINDRGPFVHGRILDLSFEAARRLGAVEDGVVPISIYLIDKTGEMCYSVQVGAFRVRENARSYARRIRERCRCGTRVVERAGYYKVLAGRFDRKEAASAFGAGLKVDFFVVGCD